MGTVHIDDPLDELLNGVTEDEEWDGLSDFENSSDDEFHDAPTTIDEDYPFQPLAPPLRRDPTLHTKKPRQHCTNGLRHEDMDFALIESTGSINKPLLRILDTVLSSVTEPIIGAKNIWRTGFAKGIKGRGAAPVRCRWC
jgi:hypothetical protein